MNKQDEVIEKIHERLNRVGRKQAVYVHNQKALVITAGTESDHRMQRDFPQRLMGVYNKQITDRYLREDLTYMGV